MSQNDKESSKKEIKFGQGKKIKLHVKKKIKVPEVDSKNANISREETAPVNVDIPGKNVESAEKTIDLSKFSSNPLDKTVDMPAPVMHDTVEQNSYAIPPQVPHANMDQTIDIPESERTELLENSQETIAITEKENETVELPSKSRPPRQSSFVSGNSQQQTRPASRAEKGDYEVRPGDHMLHYEINRIIGKGGMGMVFDALDTSLQRQVAIKTLHPHMVKNREILLRFQKEAQALAQVRHPNVVQIYGLHEQNGIHFFAMEFIKGGLSLEEHLETRNYFDEKEATQIMIEVCEGLAAIHRKGIIHRDIKPANIMMDKNIPRIADFGIAQWNLEKIGPGSGQTNSSTTLTGHGKIVGTPSYLAPECYMGKQASYATDIYALGVMFFELLTGKKPFKGATLQEIAVMHLNHELPLLCEVNHSISLALSQIVKKMLAKNMTQRYQTIDEVIHALKQMLGEWEKAKEDVTRKALGMEMAQMMAGTVTAENVKFKRSIIFVIVAILGIIGLIFSLGNIFEQTETKKPTIAGNAELDSKWQVGKWARASGIITYVLPEEEVPENSKGTWLAIDNSIEERLVMLNDTFLLESGGIVFEPGVFCAFQGKVTQASIAEEDVLYLKIDSRGLIPWKKVDMYCTIDNIQRKVEKYEDNHLDHKGSMRGTIIYREKTNLGLWVLLGSIPKIKDEEEESFENSEEQKGELYIAGVLLHNLLLKNKKISAETVRIGDALEITGVIKKKIEPETLEQEEKIIYYLHSIPGHYLRIFSNAPKIQKKNL